MKKKLIIIITSVFLLISCLVVVLILLNNKVKETNIILDNPYNNNDYVLEKVDMSVLDSESVPFKHVYSFKDKEERDNVFANIKSNEKIYKVIEDENYLVYKVDGLFYCATIENHNFINTDKNYDIVTYPLIVGRFQFFMGYEYDGVLRGTYYYDELDTSFNNLDYCYNYFGIKTKEDILYYYSMISTDFAIVEDNVIRLRNLLYGDYHLRITLYDTYMEIVDENYL